VTIRALVLLLMLGLSACDRPGTTSPDVDVADALQSGAESGFARATQPRRFRFPRDHGPHRDFRNEWWYLTGNLESADGRPFGFQATFFRIALTPRRLTGSSHWRARDIFMADVALSDMDGERFLTGQRLSRGALGLAGVSSRPLRVWLENWSLEAEEGGGFPWHLTVDDGAFALELDFEKAGVPVLQGDEGLSQKSAQPGNASYYYSIPRLATKGSVTLDGKRYRVTGLSWLDREWSTSALGGQQVGWDWFGLQLDDGTDLMYYRLRRAGGGTDPHSEGTLVSDGRKKLLSPETVGLEPVRYWESPRGGRYPVQWRLEIPDAGLKLHIRPRLDDQEQHGIVRYWEGAVSVDGTRNGEPIAGRGYAALTGYAFAKRNK